MANGENDDGKPEEAEGLTFEDIYDLLVDKTLSRLEKEIARDIRIGGVTPDDRLIEAKRQREMFDIDRKYDSDFAREVHHCVLEDVCEQLRPRLH